MFRLIIVVCIFVSLGFSQQDNAKKQANQTEGEEIILQARKVIGLDKSGEVSSYSHKLKVTYFNNSTNQNYNLATFEEASLQLSGKIYVVQSSRGSLFSQLTRTWNDDKYKAIFEWESSSGQRTVKDVTNQEARSVSKAVSDVLGKKTTAALQNAQKTEPKKIFTESLWTSLFPLILSHPFEKKIEFIYVGKAKANDKTANVVDMKLTDGKTYRLFFDSDTHYLLMMIFNHKESNDRFVGDVEEKYYFSDREIISGILIPKKIKVEQKATASGQPPIVKFSNIEILEFKLNPEFKKDLFEIK
jgi:hypothetical protein